MSNSIESPSSVEFGFVAAAAGAPGAGDAELYQDVVDNCVFHASLGYGTAWMLEHHFSDYFPTPDPLLLMAHVAARCPELNLGTCVICSPWHQPLRLAESIAMLSHLTERQLHMGLGRGTSPLEFEAFGIDMVETRARFRETWEIIRLAMTGEPFTYEGAHLRVPRKVRLRPSPGTARINFYGAIASSTSAPIMAELGLPPMCTSVGDMERQTASLRAWEDRAREVGTPTDVVKPIMINCIIEDTDEGAVRQAQTYMTRYMAAQVRHYEAETIDYKKIKSYEEFKPTFERMKAMCEPANIVPWTRWQLIGTSETVAEKVRAFTAIGFNHIIIHTATPGVPPEVGREWSRRFATEVIPVVQAPVVV
jgi:alkanesulfonate monooxygenase SsuD/methylene tetrahydromethanopterin reductase-like flavin-dependent oxidoreductase (luciferase family)